MGTIVTEGDVWLGCFPGLAGSHPDSLTSGQGPWIWSSSDFPVVSLYSGEHLVGSVESFASVAANKEGEGR